MVYMTRGRDRLVSDPLKSAKKNPIISDRVFRFKAWRCPTLTWGGPTLPSALSCFTSEFGMGSGGSNSLLPPDKLVEKSKSDTVLQVSDSYFSKLESQYTLSITSNILYIQVLTNKHPLRIFQLSKTLGVIWSSLTVN